MVLERGLEGFRVFMASVGLGFQCVGLKDVGFGGLSGLLSALLWVLLWGLSRGVRGPFRFRGRLFAFFSVLHACMCLNGRVCLCMSVYVFNASLVVSDVSV